MSENLKVDIAPLFAANWPQWSVRVQPTDLTTPEAAEYSKDAKCATGLLIRYAGRDAQASEAHSRFISLQDTSFSFATLNNELFAIGLIQAMGDSYSTLRTNICPTISKDDVLSAVHADQIRDDTRTSDFSEAALIATSTPPTAKFCDWCKTKTHNTEACRSMTRATGEQ
ncbi:hypothetical protein PIIN_06344 [Serendipita indica DSM 11827]|uniref:Uncharacterized protein n=1 Tax=Serendipita indica (strain DSM 11827) TaxID=1109443 RepID=G4TM67_SERID|nr:hypothetical protein PIIN_06344 [Serendipita indica DSM 11827]